MTVLTRSRRVDDDDEDINDFDPAYFPRKVYKDGRGPRVKLMLTDSMPPDYRAAISRRPALTDARHYYPPRTYVGDSAALRDAERKATEARDAWIRGLQDAWKTPTGAMQTPPDNSDPDGDEDDDDLSPRDAYIQRLQGAYRTPIGNGYGNGNGNGADAIEAQRRRWTREDGGGGRAPSSVTFGQHAPSAFPSRDAASLRDARAAADQAHAEYVARISNAWKAR